MIKSGTRRYKSAPRNYRHYQTYSEDGTFNGDEQFSKCFSSSISGLKRKRTLSSVTMTTSMCSSNDKSRTLFLKVIPIGFTNQCNAVFNKMSNLFSKKENKNKGEENIKNKGEEKLKTSARKSKVKKSLSESSESRKKKRMKKKRKESSSTVDSPSRSSTWITGKFKLPKQKKSRKTDDKSKKTTKTIDEETLSDTESTKVIKAREKKAKKEKKEREKKEKKSRKMSDAESVKALKSKEKKKNRDSSSESISLSRFLKRKKKNSDSSLTSLSSSGKKAKKSKKTRSEKSKSKAKRSKKKRSSKGRVSDSTKASTIKSTEDAKLLEPDPKDNDPVTESHSNKKTSKLSIERKKVHPVLADKGEGQSEHEPVISDVISPESGFIKSMVDSSKMATTGLYTSDEQKAKTLNKENSNSKSNEEAEANKKYPTTPDRPESRAYSFRSPEAMSAVKMEMVSSANSMFSDQRSAPISITISDVELDLQICSNDENSQEANEKAEEFIRGGSELFAGPVSISIAGVETEKNGEASANPLKLVLECRHNFNDACDASKFEQFLEKCLTAAYKKVFQNLQTSDQGERHSMNSNRTQSSPRTYTRSSIRRARIQQFENHNKMTQTREKSSHEDNILAGPGRFPIAHDLCLLLADGLTHALRRREQEMTHNQNKQLRDLLIESKKANDQLENFIVSNYRGKNKRYMCARHRSENKV